MTEVELIKKMETCLENGNECDDKKCRDVLIRDALAVIKMQKERLEALVKTLGEQQAQIDGLNKLVAKRYTEQQLADAVNDIIRSIDDGDGDTDGIISTIRDFMVLVGMKGYVRFGIGDMTPEIALIE